MAPLNSAQACRKYIDLIQGISGKYPNWNPQKRIEVCRQSPIISIHLTHVFTQRWEILARSTQRTGSSFARVTCIETNLLLPSQRIILRWFMIQNMNTRSTQALSRVRRGHREKASVWQITIPLTLGRDFGDLSDIVYKRQWKFTEDRQAFLVLYRAQRISIPDAFLDLALRADNPIPDIRTKNVVTNLWLCPAFAMYMSNKCAFSSVWDNKRVGGSDDSPTL